MAQPLKARCEHCGAVSWFWSATPLSHGWQCAGCKHIHARFVPLSDALESGPDELPNWQPTEREQRRLEYARHLLATGRIGEGIE